MLLSQGCLNVMELFPLSMFFRSRKHEWLWGTSSDPSPSILGSASGFTDLVMSPFTCSCLLLPINWCRSALGDKLCPSPKHFLWWTGFFYKRKIAICSSSHGKTQALKLKFQVSILFKKDQNPFLGVREGWIESLRLADANIYIYSIYIIYIE